MAPPLARRAVLALVLLAPLSGCAREPQRPNVLLVVIDTLRADRLSAAGYARETTPHLDRLAAEGLRFTHAQTPRAKTTPAMATLFSGLYPHDHGARDLTRPLAPEVPLLAERLAASGYTTLGIIGNYVLQARLAGLERGFGHWIEELPQTSGLPPAGVPERTARSLTDGALAALGLGAPSADGAAPRAALLEPSKPWFLYLHYMDPHGLYEPPPEHRVFHSERPDPIPRPLVAQPGAAHPPWVAEYNVLDEDRLSDGRIDANSVRDRYDGEVRYVDAELGRLFEGLRAAGLLERTLVIVVADHGESLGEHDYWFEHGRNASEVTCRVPLLVRFPADSPWRGASGVRRADVSLADLAPTLCAWLDLAPPREPGRDPLVGRARPELALRDDPAPTPVLCEKVERADLAGAVQTKAVRLGDWKLLVRLTFLPSEAALGARRRVVLGEELHDLSRDPYETRDLSGEPPRDAPLAELRVWLARFLAADPDLGELGETLGRERDELRRIDPDTLRRLESLGY